MRDVAREEWRQQRTTALRPAQADLAPRLHQRRLAGRARPVDEPVPHLRRRFRAPECHAATDYGSAVPAARSAVEGGREIGPRPDHLVEARRASPRSKTAHPCNECRGQAHGGAHTGPGDPQPVRRMLPCLHRLGALQGRSRQHRVRGTDPHRPEQPVRGRARECGVAGRTHRPIVPVQRGVGRLESAALHGHVGEAPGLGQVQRLGDALAPGRAGCGVVSWRGRRRRRRAPSRPARLRWRSPPSAGPPTSGRPRCEEWNDRAAAYRTSSSGVGASGRCRSARSSAASASGNSPASRWQIVEQSSSSHGSRLRSASAIWSRARRTS